MATATESTEKAAERSSQARRTDTGKGVYGNGYRPLEDSLRHGQDAASDLIQGWVDFIHRFLPALARPTDAVDYSFELASDGLALGHRVCHDLAELVETGTADPSTRRSAG